MLQVTSCSYRSHKTNTALPQQIMYTIILDHNPCRVILMGIYISSIMLSSSIFQLKLYATKIKLNPEIHSTYQADAFNMDTLDHLYTDIAFSTQDILIYCTVSRCYFHSSPLSFLWCMAALPTLQQKSTNTQVFQRLGNCYCMLMPL